MSRYEVVAGQEFEIAAVEVSDVAELVVLADIVERQQKARIRERLTYLIFGALLVAIAVAALVGYLDGTFDEIGYVWGAAALPLGYLLRTYFEKVS
jgi:hypothetical protein